MPEKPSINRKGTMAATVTEAKELNLGASARKRKAGASAKSKPDAAESLGEANDTKTTTIDSNATDKEEEAPSAAKPRLKKNRTMAATVAEASERGFGAAEGERSAATKAKDSIKIDSPKKRKAPKKKKGVEEAEPEDAEEAAESAKPAEPTKPAKAAKKGTMVATVQEAADKGLSEVQGKRSASNKAKESIKASAPQPKKEAPKTKKADEKKPVETKTEEKKSARIARKGTMAVTATEGEQFLEEES
ncbi:hypothetical protein HK096_008944, partial [Nowakowskiella sp. JEL0078]